MRHVLVSIVFASFLTGCGGDPLSNVPRLSDVEVSDGSASVTAAQSEERQAGGLFGRLLNRQADDPTNAAVEAALRDVDAPTEEEPVAVAAVESPRRGLGGLFGRRQDRADIPRTGPDSTDVEPGTVMPFGQIARVCGVSQSNLGRLVGGGAGFRVYDTIPQTTSRRPFYITGFADNCARTFTGAVVVPGDIQTHEFVRYQASNERIEYSTADNAYEALKASVCRVGRGQPCGERTARLSQNTHFITVYDFFGGTFSAVPTQWAQILVHDGEVLAMSLKDG